MQFFEPQGMGSEVHPYLRTKNPVRNRNITKRDMEILVRGILSTREYQQAMVDRRSQVNRGSAKDLRNEIFQERKLHDHIFDFLKAKVGNFQSVIAEWGYNMLEGLRRYVDDPEIEFFKLLLEEQLSEAVLHDMNCVVFEVFDELQVRLTAGTG